MFSAVAWQLTLDHPKKQKQAGGKLENPEDTNAHEGNLCVLIFRSLISSDKAVNLLLWQLIISYDFLFFFAPLPNCN